MNSIDESVAGVRAAGQWLDPFLRAVDAGGDPGEVLLELWHAFLRESQGSSERLGWVMGVLMLTVLEQRRLLGAAPAPVGGSARSRVH